MTEFTEDAILGGAVAVIQPRHGDRFSVDALQLADFALRRPFRRALDLGCGTGVVAFVLAHRAPRARVVGVEVDAALCALAREGAARNRFGERVAIVEGDLRRIDSAVGHAVERAAFDLVVANPPYHSAGRASPDASRARARHEIACTLADVLRAAAFACAPRGRVALILPSERLVEALALAPRDFRATALRFVHPRGDRPARRALLEFRRGVREALAVLPSLVVHDGAGYSAEMRRMLGEA